MRRRAPDTSILRAMASPLDLDLRSLPPDVRAFVEAERTARLALEQEVAELSERNARLEHLVQEFQKALHGKRSEKLSGDERQLAFEDLETAVAEAEAGRLRPARGLAHLEPPGATSAACRRSCRGPSAWSSRRARSARAAAAR